MESGPPLRKTHIMFKQVENADVKAHRRVDIQLTDYESILSKIENIIRILASLNRVLVRDMTGLSTRSDKNQAGITRQPYLSDQFQHRRCSGTNSDLHL